ncbi:hypothetical protein AB1285_26755 [Microbacterium sp. NRRL B-14842]|uniref:hypothetical protein n=1 Tax=Microbacterium TaxID=33882 RepID=UPI0002588B13|nr:MULTISPECIES: hypothetical protein [Microbacterium]EIC07787.1 hypothetical protein OR221_2108 [Microbacterium laevaniformans OR221]MAP62196.1 hypothetical protein [Microbacterium sp.]QXE31778.1 hypothetical protein IZR02_17570 [Microbacterium paraoxydans]
MPNPAPTTTGTDSSLLTPIQRQRALTLSDALWRLRTGQHDAGDDITLTIPAPAIEGIEKILFALAEGDLRFASVRAGQLMDGVSAALRDRAVGEQWRAAFDHARQDGHNEAEAREFADEYAAYVEDRQYELRDPDLPIPSPSEYTR